MSLLEKTRILNRLLQQKTGRTVNFHDTAGVLSDVIEANVYVVGQDGKILGFSVKDYTDTNVFESKGRKEDDFRIHEQVNNLLLKIEQTASEVEEEQMDRVVMEKISEAFQQHILTIIPIAGKAERMGTLVLSRKKDPFVENDLVLAEYSAAIIAMEILRTRTESMESEVRSKAAVSAAVNSLSFSEMEAVERIFEELSEKEGLLVASKVADKAQITRSVIVNALRKLESAGIIETRSLGMKGTYIRILNDHLYQQLNK